MKVGVIGLGKMGRLHMMNCQYIDDVEVVAAADQSKVALKEAKSIGVSKLYTDYHELLSNCHELDAVIIALPNFLHFESVRSALESGLNVFIEKPLARNVDECLSIVKLVESSGRRLMVGHCMRFLEVVQEMKEMEEKGYIGSIEVVTLEDVINGPFRHGIVPSPVADWWFDPAKAGGGALLDIGYHMIDLFHFIVGDSRVVFSSLDHKLNLLVEDGAIVILESSNRSTKGIVNVGWYQKTIFPKFNFRMILHGNSGYVSSDDLIPRNLYLHAAKEGMKNLLRKVIGKKIQPLSYTYYYKAFYSELKHFFDCLKQDLEPSVSALDGLRTVQLIEEAYARASR